MGGAPAPERLERLEARDRGRADVLRVLLHDEDVDAALLEQHLAHLAGRHPFVSLARVLDTFEGGHPLPPRALLLAFRGPAGFAARAWPVLRRHECAALLFVPQPALAEGGEAGLAELLGLARAGVALGLCDAPGSPDARALAALERLVPGAPRVLLHAEARPDAVRVAAARAAGIELAFAPLPGANDLRAADRLRLRSIPVEARTPLGALRERLARSACRGGEWAPPPTPEEQSARRELRRRRRRVRFVLRPLDALLTAGGEPRPAWSSALRALVRARSSHYERLRNLARVTLGALPPLERALRRRLLDPARLPVPCNGLELAGHGTAATVFRLEARPGTSPQVLKTYRWTLGHPPQEQAWMIRRHDARYRQLRAWFGERVLRTHYLVLHGPLRGLAVAGCLQERVEHARDLLACPDGELLALLRARPAAARELVAFVRTLESVRREGFFPDLLGAGNLLLVGDGPEARLRLVDYGLFDLRTGTAHLPLAAIEAATRRCERLATELERRGADPV